MKVPPVSAATCQAHLPEHSLLQVPLHQAVLPALKQSPSPPSTPAFHTPAAAPSSAVSTSSLPCSLQSTQSGPSPPTRSRSPHPMPRPLLPSLWTGSVLTAFLPRSSNQLHRFKTLFKRATSGAVPPLSSEPLTPTEPACESCDRCWWQPA